MKKKRSHVFRGLASICLAIMVVFSVVAQVADNWAEKVNELLGESGATITRSANAEDYRYQSDYSNPSDLVVDEIELSTRMAAEGTVVLKGQPMLTGKNVTLLGMRSGRQMQFGGSMGELIDASNIVTLATAMAANGFTVNPDAMKFYEDQEPDYAPTRSAGGNIVGDYDGQGSAVGEVPVSAYSDSLPGDYKDAAIIVLGRDAGESSCFYPGLNGLSNPAEFTKSPTGNILSLSNDERDLVNWAKAQGFGKIVVLLNSSTAMEIDELKQDDAIDCIMWIGNPGAYGTYGIAKLLSGEALPSGHLPDTFAVNSALSPAAQNYGIYTFANVDEIETTKNHALRAEWYLMESEGIYTGYKYYETRYFDSVLGQGNVTSAMSGEAVNGSRTWNYDDEVSYAFGYGVEGSTFTEEITAVNIDWTGATPSAVGVRVMNTGDVAAKHAVQLYVSAPYTDYDKTAGLEKAVVQLVGYAKTGEARESSFRDVVLLEPGEVEEVTISFNAQDLYSYDRLYAHDDVTGAYVLESGDYWFVTGNGAHDAANAVLASAHSRNDIAYTGAAHLETLSEDMRLTESNGTLIQNEMDDADLNNWGADVTVTYLSRSDWAGTFPATVESLTATPEMITFLRNETYDAAAELADYTGPTSFTYGANNGVRAVDLVGLGYDDPKYDQLLDEMKLEDLINQYIAYVGEIAYIDMPKENAADSPLGFIATIGQCTAGSIYELSGDDEAYGHFTDVYPGGPLVAATFSPLLQSEEGRLIANDCIWDGYTHWYGPGLNLHRTPYNGRNIAYYSEDAMLTGLTAAYVHQSLNKYGIVTNAKHFAFNDQETNRDGIATFINEQAARENELRGFQIAIRDGGMKGVMSAFNRLGVTHVAAHRGVMNGILRGEWGFRGFVITDSVKSAQYFLPRECLMAGNDMMLGGSNNGKIWNMTVDAVSADPVIQAGLREAYHHKLYVGVNSVQMNGITPETNASGALVWWALILRILMGIGFAGFVTFAVLFIIRDRRERGK